MNFVKKLVIICLGIAIFGFFRNWSEEANEMPLTYFYEEDMLQVDNDEGSIEDYRISDFVDFDNDTEIEEEFAGDKYNFYYDSLETSMGKRMYSEFYQAVKNFENSFYITSNTRLTDEVGAVFLHVLYDNPSFFYVDYSSILIEQTEYNSVIGGKVVCKVKWDYLYSEEEVRSMLSSYENMINTYLKRDYSSDYELAEKVFRFVSDIVKYGGRSEDGQTIDSAFSNQQAVCGGYTMASKYIFDYLGIPCIYVIGTVNNQNSYENMGQNSMDHAWNKIMLNGEWYNFDSTWGDIEIEGYKYYNYKYLMVSDEVLYRTHVPWLQYAEKYPKCFAQTDYYSRNNLYFDLYEDPNVFLNEFINILNFYKSNVVQFRVENIQEFETFLKEGYLYYYMPFIDGFTYEKYSHIVDYDSNVVTILFSN